MLGSENQLIPVIHCDDFDKTKREINQLFMEKGQNTPKKGGLSKSKSVSLPDLNIKTISLIKCWLAK